MPISLNKRYVAKNGLPVLIPTNPIELITSNLLSTKSKLLLKPYLWTKKRVSDDHTQESVGGFFQRHFGKEVVDYLIDPFVAGTSAGDPESLSMPHSFPELWNIEKRHSLIHCANSLANMSLKSVILTAPLCSIKEMKITKRGSIFPFDFLPEVTYMPLAVLITSFKKENVHRPLEGFGVLVPSKEQENGLKTLGTLFSSMMFPDRAPSDQYLYTTFVGGSRNKELAKASTNELKQIVTSDISQLLGAEGDPTFVNHYYWSKAFPLYGHDYYSVVEAIEKMEKNLPGLFYAGNHRGGLSVGKAIASGCKAADLVISYLESSSDTLLQEGS